MAEWTVLTAMYSIVVRWKRHIGTATGGGTGMMTAVADAAQLGGKWIVFIEYMAPL